MSVQDLKTSDDTSDGKIIRYHAWPVTKLCCLLDMSGGARAIQIVLAKDHAFELDVDSLENLLLSDEVRERKVMVVSVAGAFRKGKSFLLDFFIRYLNAVEADVKVGILCITLTLESIQWCYIKIYNSKVQSVQYCKLSIIVFLI